MKKKSKILFFAILTIVVLTFMTGCDTKGKSYFNTISAYSFWDNDSSQSIAQYKLYDIMNSYLSENIVDGKSVDEDGKTRKVLFLGWDGARADALTNILYDENNFDTNNYNYMVDDYSGIRKLKSQGGLYLAYAGGETSKDSEQQTSTCAGWTSILTGGWKTYHGVDYNDDIINAGAETIMLQLAKKGLDTGLAFDWGQLFDTTFQTEIDYLLSNPDTPMRLRDIDRPKAQTKADILKNEGLSNEKDIRAKGLEHYNAVAMEGDIHSKAKYDIAMRDYIVDRINADDDFVGGIFHRPDTNGHNYGFTNDNAHYVNSIRNADIYLYQIMEILEERESKLNEDWLIVVTADHGGSKMNHGKQIAEHRTTWIAVNKTIQSDFYGKNYDGFTENSK